MRTTTSVDEVRSQVNLSRSNVQTVGCVPTMGALHAGHLSLIAAARDECDVVVVTLFVNAPQFNDSEDYQRYPRPLTEDLDACRQLGVDLVFHPSNDTIYPPGDETRLDVGQLARVLEGHHRPGHFLGVATVVVKLLNIVTPHVAYFGMKDYQQQLVIRRLMANLHLPVTIRACPTVREEDGLALSSRNVLLSPEERQTSTVLFRSLQLARRQLNEGMTDLDGIRTAMRQLLEAEPEVQVDYATLADPLTLEEAVDIQPELVALVAAHVGRARLIDNLLIELNSPSSDFA